MQIVVTFTQEELRLIAKALTFGIINTDNDDEEQQIKKWNEKLICLKQYNMVSNFWQPLLNKPSNH